MREHLLDLSPHAEHGPGQHVIRLAPQTDLALLAKRRQLAVSTPAGQNKIFIILPKEACLGLRDSQINQFIISEIYHET